MKVLYLCPDLGIPVLGRKGASVHVRELVAAFNRAGHDVVLAAQMLNKSPWEKPAEVGVPVIQIRPAPAASAAVLALKQFNEVLGAPNSLPGELRRILYNKELETELTRRFENDPPDFIYERASLYATGGVSVAHSLGTPLVVELNAPLALEQKTYRATGFGSLASEAERWTLSHAHAVIVVSSLLRDHVLSLGVPAERVHVLPNGVNPAIFHPGTPNASLRSRLNLNGGPVLGFVGGLRPWHGVEVLPELFERLARENDDLRLVIAGDGPLRSALQRELKQRGLDSRALITGLVEHEQVPDLIRQFDIALAPYPAPEHAFYFSPLKVFEYMACGVALIAPRLGQISQVLRDGKNALLYPAGDIEALAAGCQRLLDDAGLRRKLGRAAAKEIQTGFTWDHNAERVIEIVQGLKTAARGERRNLPARKT